MKYRPSGLVIYSFICVAIALSFPVQILFLFDLGPLDLRLIFDKLTVTNWAVMLILFSLAHAAYHGSIHFKWLAPLAVLFVAANNYWVGSVGQTYTANESLLATGLFSVFCFSPYLLPRARNVFAKPNLRWWRADHRYSVQFPVTLILEDSTEIKEVLTYDVSRSGLFIQSALMDFYGLKTGDRLSIRWQSPDHQLYERDAEVVRLSEPNGRYPRGLGVQFDYRAPKDSFI